MGQNKNRNSNGFDPTNFEEGIGFVIQPMKPDVIDFHPVQDDRKIQTDYFLETNKNPFTNSDVKDFNRPESKKKNRTRPLLREPQIVKPVTLEPKQEEVRVKAVMLEPDNPNMRKEDYSKPAKLELSNIAKSMYNNPTKEPPNPPEDNVSKRRKLKRYEPTVSTDIASRQNINSRRSYEIRPNSQPLQKQPLLSERKIAEDIDFVKFRQEKLKQRNAEKRNASLAIIGSILFSLVPLPFLIVLCKNLYSM